MDKVIAESLALVLPTVGATGNRVCIVLIPE